MSTASGSESDPRGLAVRSSHPQGKFQIVPEYERKLGRVLLVVPAAEESESKRALLLQAMYREILSVLPARTIVEIAVSRDDEPFARQALNAVGAREPLRLHVVSADKLDAWAQDVGEAVVLDGKPHFLVSATVSSSNAYNHAVTSMRSRVGNEVFGTENALTANFVFEGGNWVFDRTPDGLRVLVGFNDVEATILQEAERGKRVSRTDVLEGISSLLSGAEVVLVGTELQSPFVFHLDQAFVLLADATAVVSRIEGARSREARQLAQIQSQLEALGYRIFVIPHTLEDVRNYRSSTNTIPFVDDDGRKRILFPVFPGEVKDTLQTPLRKAHLTGKALVAFETYETAGYEPTPVPDFTAGAGGSIHCLVNVLD